MFDDQETQTDSEMKKRLVRPLVAFARGGTSACWEQARSVFGALCELGEVSGRSCGSETTLT